MTVRLALYKGKGTIGSALVRWWSKSQYSHCELVVGDLAYSSSIRDGGVRSKRIDFRPESWDFVELPWADPAAVLQQYQYTAGRPYGWLDLIRSQVFNRPGNERGDFCSEWCTRALGLPDPQLYSPATLGRTCAWINDLTS